MCGDLAETLNSVVRRDLSADVEEDVHVEAEAEAEAGEDEDIEGVVESYDLIAAIDLDDALAPEETGCVSDISTSITTSAAMAALAACAKIQQAETPLEINTRYNKQ